MPGRRRFLTVLAAVVAPLGVIAAGAGRAASQAVASSDTMEHVRADTASLAARRRHAVFADLASQYRQDSIADDLRQQRRLFAGRPLYYGVAAGVSQPVGDLRAGYTTGWSITVPVGWNFAGTPLGIRMDGSWNRLMGQTSIASYISDVTIWSMNGDALLRHRVEHLGPSGAVYVLGGGGVHRIIASAVRGDVANVDANGFATSLGSAQTRWGLNAGAGATLTLGQLALFVESRYVGFRSGNVAAPNARLVPIVAGLLF